MVVVVGVEAEKGAGILQSPAAPRECAAEHPQAVLYGAEPALHVAAYTTLHPHLPGSYTLSHPGVLFPSVTHKQHLSAVFFYEFLHEARR
ncbi:MAG: hypothetical protein ACUVXA_10845, partial [Candidatus Jordarchaeum sp.]|uniref:hypothetical protein n=1 Tax=Candidatus Jordarchaeum sp. TaxID=2823881 RepID=UPI004049A1D8